MVVRVRRPLQLKTTARAMKKKAHKTTAVERFRYRDLSPSTPPLAWSLPATAFDRHRQLDSNLFSIIRSTRVNIVLKLENNESRQGHIV